MAIPSFLHALRRALRPGSASPASPGPPTHLPVSGRVPLAEPLGLIHAAFSHDRRRAVAVGERTGRLWLLEIDPAARSVDARPLPLTVPRTPDGTEWLVTQMSGSHTLHRLLLWTDRLRVHALPSCDVVAEPGDAPGRATCLSPAGRSLISVSEEQGWRMNLAASAPAWTQTYELHRMERADDGQVEGLYLDHVDAIAAHPCGAMDGGEDDAEALWLAAACYGMVVIHRVETSWSGIWRVEGASRGYGDLVYDPTELPGPWGHRHAFVVHGYGTGLAALDPETGEQHHCWIRGRRQQPYAFISRVVACGEAPIAWGHSKDGAFLWRVGQPPVMMPDPPGTVLALFPGALLCLAPDGGELLWAELPEEVVG
jgi:hypothetical protein